MRLEMIENDTSGILITFCGLDGSGKTTQINRLVDYLSEMDISIFLTKQPTNAVRQSEIFRAFMDTPNPHAFDYRALSLMAASDRIQHSNSVILPALREGNTVISDRYFYSCIGNLYARGYIDDKWIYEVAKFIPKPDIAFFIDVDVDTAIQRVRSRTEERDRYIDIELQYRLRAIYLKIALENGGIILSGKEPEETCFKRVREHVLGAMKLV